MNDSQLIVLRDDINNSVDPAIVAARGGGAVGRDDNTLANLYNQTGTKWLWKPVVLLDEIVSNGFTWVEVDNLTIGKARIWEWLFDNANKSINAAKPNVRAGIAECWSGTAAKQAVQASVLSHCKRRGTRAESLFVVGTGTEADPGVSGFIGLVSAEDIGRAFQL